MNRLQSSPVRATRMDFLSTEDEKVSSRKTVEPRVFKSQPQSLTAQSSQKDLSQQIDCLGFISEIKGLKLQNKDLLTDLKVTFEIIDADELSNRIFKKNIRRSKKRMSF